MGEILGGGGQEKAARETAARQQIQIAEQKQKEQLKLAEEEDAIGRRKALARGGGRQSLINTSQKGVTQNLGGT